MLQSAIFATVASLALFASVAESHQRIKDPEPTWITEDRYVQFGPNAFLEDQGYATVEDFNGWRVSKGYKTLRSFMDDPKAYYPIDGANFECGFTDGNGAVRAVPTNGEIRTTGYTHDGPCEIWLDNTRVLAGTNCVVDHPGEHIPIDFSSCTDTCMLRWYWLGIRFLDNRYSWQIYKECIPLKRSQPVTTTPKPTTTTPKPTTTPPPTTPPPTTPKPTTASPPVTTAPVTPGPPSGLVCNYEGKLYAICRNANAWSYENGVVCVGISRCVSQSPPYGVVYK